MLCNWYCVAVFYIQVQFLWVLVKYFIDPVPEKTIILVDMDKQTVKSVHHDHVLYVWLGCVVLQCHVDDESLLIVGMQL